MAKDKSIAIQVLTSQGVAVSDEAVSVRAPGGLGSFGILYNHAPLVSTLTPGKLQWKHADGSERAFEVSGGIIEVAHNRCTVLTASVKETSAGLTAR